MTATASSPLEWHPDILGAPYEAATIPLPDDDEGSVVATLVRAGQPQQRRAVLHIHGFADYFFHTQMAQYWSSRGYDFYAIDLRKYGRSLLPHQTPNFTTSLAIYRTELELAWQHICHTHDHILVSAHSTGGLTAALWLHYRHHVLPQLQGLVLNSPWLAMQGNPLEARLLPPVIAALGRWAPKLVIPRNVNTLYAQSLHRDYLGTHEFNLNWKPLTSWPVRAGWVRTIWASQQLVAAGLNIPVPVLVAVSARSSLPKSVADPDLFSTDVVLSVEPIAQIAPQLGPQVWVRRIPGAIHDLTLSTPPVLHAVLRVFDDFSRGALGNAAVKV